MAHRARPLATTAGAGALFCVLALTLGTLGAVLWRGEGFSALTARDWDAVLFTVWQAALSALFSCLLAIPLARALARRTFPGRGALITLLGAPFILPVIVAVLGVLAVFGRSGLISQGLGAFGLPPIDIFGLPGILIVHVFFNLPLATRLLLQAWLAVPAERLRLAAALGFGPRDIFRQIEWPLLRETIPGAFLVIFLICLTSFAVALALGGGPRATTVELAIYQAFRFDFDLGRAAALASMQFLLCAAVGIAVFWISVPQVGQTGLDRSVPRWDAATRILRLQDAALLSLASLFLLLPMALVLGRGIGTVLDLPSSVWAAAGRSLILAIVSTAICIVLALALSLWVASLKRSATLVEALAMLPIAASPLVIGTGAYLLLFFWVNPVAMALPVTALTNAAMALPFALRALVPAVRATELNYGRLADSLSMSGWARLRYLSLPRLARPLGFSAGLAAALSMGDLGVIALFADPDYATLPLEMYRLMGAYRQEEAAGAALLLVLLSLGLFWVFDRGGRTRATA